MKRMVLIILLLAASLAYAAELKKLTFEQAYLDEGEKIFNPLPQIFGWADDRHYYQMEKGKLFKVHAKSGKQKLALDPAKYTETLKPLGEHANLFTAVDRTKDLNKFLFLAKGDIFLFLTHSLKILQLNHYSHINQEIDRRLQALTLLNGSRKIFRDQLNRDSPPEKVANHLEYQI